MADVLQGIGVVNFEVYLSGTTRMLGIANLELPSIEKATTDMSGAGLMGTTSMPFRGNINSLEAKLTWRTMEKTAAELLRHESIRLSLYSDQEHYDGGSGRFSDPSHYVEITGAPKTFALGKWEPSSTIDADTTLEVFRLTYKIDDTEIISFDKFNYVFRVLGEDYAQPYRKAVKISN